ncbi:hypothetical protein [Actinorugispora endophytica]|uniref:PH (Pleckstrin Homology) domain-containing protein n=1 Tax=Actinorugispora endophytica TaxID=1605990 RepID=A0A4R6USL2_9ACTN|nr:hypothetical protein [Actinorugispora endophytica]TDQ48799.1 hypothetical protein EV190_11755 [Actinorugispora endophytica]
MPVSAAVRARVRGFLPVEAEIRYIFPASWNESVFFVFVVTDAAVTVLTNRMFSRSRPKEIWHVFPRAVRIGPVDTHLIPTFELGGRQFEVHEEYVPVINAADAELSPGALPPDPLSEL